MLMLKFVPKTAMSFVQLQATKLFQPGPQATPLFLAHNEYQQRRIDFPPPAKTTNRRSKAIYSLPFVPPPYRTSQMDNAHPEPQSCTKMTLRSNTQ